MSTYIYDYFTKSAAYSINHTLGANNILSQVIEKKKDVIRK